MELKKWFVERNNIGLECILEKWGIKYLGIPSDERSNVKWAKCDKTLKKWYTYKSNKKFVDFPNTVINLL